MPRVNLRGRFGYGRPRVYYGPGVVDVPEGLVLALGLKTEEPAQPDPLVDFPLLKEAGYASAEEVRAADDAALLAIKGIGPAMLRRIRKAL